MTTLDTHTELQPRTGDFVHAIGPAYVDCGVSIRRFTTSGDRVEVWRGSVAELVGVLAEAQRMLAYVVTMKRKNRPEWMEGLVERSNALLEALKDPDRILVDETDLAVKHGSA